MKTSKIEWSYGDREQALGRIGRAKGKVAKVVVMGNAAVDVHMRRAAVARVEGLKRVKGDE